MATLSTQKTKTKAPKVKISNDFVYSFIKKNNQIAIKIIFYLAHNIKEYPTNKDYITFRLDTKELTTFCNVNRKTLIQAFISIQKISISFTTEKDTEYFTIFPRVKDIYNGKIEIDIHHKVLEQIISIKKKYSAININNISKIKYKHSLRMLMILENISGYNNNALPMKYFSLEELNALFGTKYTRAIYFQNKILQKIKDDLDNLSDLSFVYNPVYEKTNIKQGRAKMIGFRIFPNNNTPRPTLF